MDVETIVEFAGLILVGAALLRGTVAASLFAGRSIQLSTRRRRQIKAFRATVERHVARFEAGLKHNLPGWQGTRTLQVVQRMVESPNGEVCSFYLASPDGQPLPAYRPGQFLTLQLPAADSPGDLTRCYSLSEYPAEQQTFYRITVKRLQPPGNAPNGTPPGLVSSLLHGYMRPGSMVHALAPAGTFCLDQSSTRPIVLIAGGIGLTPLLSMLNWLAATRSGRQVWLFYGVRNRAEHAFYDHLSTLRRDHANIHVVVFYSQPTPSCRKGVDYDVAARINIDILKALLRRPGYEFYICGPVPMMQMLMRDLRAWGVPQRDIKFEGFGRGEVLAKEQGAGGRPSAVTIGSGNTDETRQIRFARSKTSVAWARRDGTLLEFAEACGVSVKSACRSGQCGTCKVALKAGEVDYIQTPAAMPETGSCLLCVSQPKTDLVLEL